MYTVHAHTRNIFSMLDSLTFFQAFHRHDVYKINLIEKIFSDETLNEHPLDGNVLGQFSTDAISIRFNKFPKDARGNDVQLKVRELAVFVRWVS